MFCDFHKVSILYLRCVAFSGSDQRHNERRRFNSLFEMRMFLERVAQVYTIRVSILYLRCQHPEVQASPRRH